MTFVVKLVLFSVKTLSAIFTASHLLINGQTKKNQHTVKRKTLYLGTNEKIIVT